MSAIEGLIDRYEEGIRLIEEALRGVPPDALDREPAPGKWSIRQIAIHIADGEIMTAGRIRAIAGDPGCRIVPFDQDHWAANMPYSKLPVEAALAVVRALRQSTTALLRALPESAWARTAIHEERGPLSLQQMVELAASHGENHARQIGEHRARFATASR